MSYQSYRKPQKPKRRQWRKKKTPPPVQKPSVVRFLPANQLMDWDERQKMLFLDGSRHVFPAKSQAQSAIWHTVQKSGIPDGHVDYEVEDA